MEAQRESGEGRRSTTWAVRYSGTRLVFELVEHDDEFLDKAGGTSATGASEVCETRNSCSVVDCDWDSVDIEGGIDGGIVW